MTLSHTHNCLKSGNKNLMEEVNKGIFPGREQLANFQQVEVTRSISQVGKTLILIEKDQHTLLLLYTKLTK